MSDEQAFPAAWGNHEHGGDYVEGMTLRDYFAAKTLETIRVPTPVSDDYAKQIADNCYVMADAMIAARNAD